MYVFLNVSACVAQIRMKISRPGCKYDGEQSMLQPNAKSAHTQKLCLCTRNQPPDHLFGSWAPKLKRWAPSSTLHAFQQSTYLAGNSLPARALLFDTLGTKRSTLRLGKLGFHPKPLQPSKKLHFLVLSRFLGEQLHTLLSRGLLLIKERTYANFERNQGMLRWFASR